MGVDVLGGPLAALNAISCENATHLHQLLRELAQVLDVRHYPPHTYQRELDRVLSLPRAKRLPTPQYIAAQLVLDYPQRKENLTSSQKEILNYIEVESEWRSSVPQKDIKSKFQGRHDSIYWRLEALCYLGFLEKEVTDRIEGKDTYNYKLTQEYKQTL